MGTYRIARTRGRVTSCCTWCGATSPSSGRESDTERWQRVHQCMPKSTETRPMKGKP